ncbi:TonB-dependent receptor [Adhaeribacter soli]|uniref:TonB-dependent receptor n=1 Tax=Adhaeribacter soli TaxID=2607655 RepID=A0A5N1IPV8_9BACT|nr:TonB-dependent receptor [Adhaeribacter soli]
MFNKKPESLSKNGSEAGKKSDRYTISGYVREAGSGEPLIGVTVYAPERKAGIVTNNYGFYSLTLPPDSFLLQFSYVGYQPVSRQIFLNRELNLNIDLQPAAELQEVVVTADRELRSTQTTQTSKMQIPVEQVKDIPALLGEKDVLKVVQLMPGVQKGIEGSVGLHVRGGGPDQNLIILDDATVYNSNHLFGLFSLFNGDALKSIDVTKGGFPARYGGRLSSVLEMNLKEGNKEKIHGEGGIGLIATRLLLEGPIKKEKSSFLISARRTYLDALLYGFMPEDMKVGYYFFDSNIKFNYDFGRKDKVYVSGYFGRDKFYIDLLDAEMEQSSRLQWGNATGTVRWNHLFHDRLFANTSLIYSQYRFAVADKASSSYLNYNLDYFSGIQDVSLKSDFDFYPSPAHYIKFGGITTFHYFTPNAVRAFDLNSNYSLRTTQRLYSLESALYAEDFFSPLPKLLVNAGIRLSHFLTSERSYFNPEPRLSAAYRLRENTALKTSFAAMNQYVHLLSSTGTGLPIDLWVPATPRVKPQRANQVALGIAQDLFQKKAVLEIEGYYKKMKRIIAYNDNATFIAIDDPATAQDERDWEENVTSGQGWSYGVEFLLQKKTGRFTGWIGYTLSRIQHQFDSINGGRRFDARYDRRYDFSIIASYDISPTIKLSANWVYGTGNAITLPSSEYYLPTHSPFDGGMFPANLVSEFGERNNFRMPAYHRLDIGMQFRKKLSWGERTWELSVYNFYNRKNPYYYYLSSTEDRRVLRQVSFFPFIPSVNYSFKF